MKALFALGLLALTHLAGAEEIAPTPYRPTVSNPAELPVPGWLEVEAGVARSKGGDNQWQNNTPYVLKYAFSEDFGILLGGDAGVSQTDFNGQHSSGRGDNTILFKHRFSVREGQAFGLEWGAKLATAAGEVGSGKNDAIVNGIYSVDIGELRVDANAGFTRLGLREEGLGRTQQNWSVAISKEVVPKWTLAGELSGTARQGQTGASQALVAASYAASKHVVLDFGAAAGISKAAPHWSVFAGATWLVGALR